MHRRRPLALLAVVLAVGLGACSDRGTGAVERTDLDKVRAQVSQLRLEVQNLRLEVQRLRDEAGGTPSTTGPAAGPTTSTTAGR